VRLHKAENGTTALGRGASVILPRSKGEQVIIMGFELVSVAIKPSMILVDQANRFVRSLSETARSSAE
jgi:aspartate 1-decarboxylase